MSSNNTPRPPIPPRKARVGATADQVRRLVAKLKEQDTPQPKPVKQ